jgi:hypothetical protein
MKVKAIPFLAKTDAAQVQFLFQRENQGKDLEPASMDNPLRNSSSACFPASWAALWDPKPPSRSLTPMGRLLRRISQHQEF